MILNGFGLHFGFFKVFFEAVLGLIFIGFGKDFNCFFIIFECRKSVHAIFGRRPKSLKNHWFLIVFYLAMAFEIKTTRCFFNLCGYVVYMLLEVAFL